MPIVQFKKSDGSTLQVNYPDDMPAHQIKAHVYERKQKLVDMGVVDDIQPPQTSGVQQVNTKQELQNQAEQVRSERPSMFKETAKAFPGAVVDVLTPDGNAAVKQPPSSSLPVPGMLGSSAPANRASFSKAGPVVANALTQGGIDVLKTGTGVVPQMVGAALQGVGSPMTEDQRRRYEAGEPGPTTTAMGQYGEPAVSVVPEPPPNNLPHTKQSPVLDAIGRRLETGGKKIGKYWDESAKLVDRMLPAEAGDSTGNIADDVKNPYWWMKQTTRMVPNLGAAIVPGLGLLRYGLPAAAIASGATGGLMEGAGQFEKAIEEGKPRQRALGEAAAMTVASSVLNSAGATALLRKLPKGAVKQVLGRIVTGGTEGTTEAGDELASDVISGKPITAETGKKMLQVGLPAAVLGLLGGMPAEAEVASPSAPPSAAENTLVSRQESAQPGPVVETPSPPPDIAAVTPEPPPTMPQKRTRQKAKKSAAVAPQGELLPSEGVSSTPPPVAPSAPAGEADATPQTSAQETPVAPPERDQRERAFINGDEVEFTGNITRDGFREFVYLDGRRAGQLGVTWTKEEKDANLERKKREYREMQEGFRRLNEPVAPVVPESPPEPVVAQETPVDDPQSDLLITGELETPEQPAKFISEVPFREWYDRLRQREEESTKRQALADEQIAPVTEQSRPFHEQVDSAINQRARDKMLQEEGQRLLPELRRQDWEEAGRWAYVLSKGDATQEQFQAQVEEWRKEGRMRQEESIPAATSQPPSPASPSPKVENEVAAAPTKPSKPLSFSKRNSARLAHDAISTLMEISEYSERKRKTWKTGRKAQKAWAAIDTHFAKLGIKPPFKWPFDRLEDVVVMQKELEAARGRLPKWDDVKDTVGGKPSTTPKGALLSVNEPLQEWRKAMKAAGVKRPTKETLEDLGFAGGPPVGLFRNNGKYTWDQALQIARESYGINHDDSPSEFGRLFSGSSVLLEKDPEESWKQSGGMSGEEISEKSAIAQVKVAKSEQEAVPAETLDAGGLVWRNGEWMRVEDWPDGGGKNLTDGEQESYFDGEELKIGGVLYPGEAGYETAMKQYREQENKRPPVPSSGQEDFGEAYEGPRPAKARPTYEMEIDENGNRIVRMVQQADMFGGSTTVSTGAAPRQPIQSETRKVSREIREQEEPLLDDMQGGLGAVFPFKKKQRVVDDKLPEPLREMELKYPDQFARKEAAHGIGLDKTRKLRQRFRRLWTRAVRAQEHIPITDRRFHAANEFFRLRKASLSNVPDRVGQDLAGALNPLEGPNQRRVFEDYLLFKSDLESLDLMQEATNYGFQRPQLVEVIAELEAIIAASPQIQKALSNWQRLMDSVLREQLDRGLLPEDAAKRRWYVHRQILKYRREEPYAAGKAAGAHERTRGYQRKRMKVKEGAEDVSRDVAYDANSDIIEATAEYLMDAYANIANRDFLTRLDSTYGVLEQLKSTAKRQNYENLLGGPEIVNEVMALRAERREMWDSASPEERQDSAFRQAYAEIARRISDLDPTEVFRLRIAKALDKIYGTSEDSEVDPWYTDEMPSEDGGIDFDYLNELLENAARDPERAMYASQVFKAIQDRDTLYEERLGDKLLSWEKLVPEGYRPWQPKEGQIWYPATVVTQRLMQEIVQKTLRGERIDLSEQEPQLVMGGKLPAYVLPNEIADQLDSMTRKSELTGFYSNLVAIQRAVLLFGPHKVVSFMTRNTIGNIEAHLVGVGFSGIHTFFAQSSKELYDRYFGNELKTSADFDAALEAGVFTSGRGEAEIERLRKVPGFRRLYKMKALRKSKGNIVERYLDWITNINNYVESVPRYAAYLYYLDAIRKRKPYFTGATRQSVVNAIKTEVTTEELAARMARDLQIDYANQSATTEDLRAIMPFINWRVGNPVRYAKIASNSWQYGKQQRRYERNKGSGRAKQAYTQAKYTAMAGSGIAAAITLQWVWNNIIMGAVEDALSDEEKRRSHINVGWLGDKPLTFTNASGILDALDTFGLRDIIALYPEYSNGQLSLADLIAVPGKAVTNAAAQQVTGIIKTPIEAALGITTYPDIWNPRLEDRGEILSGIGAARKEFKAVRGVVTGSGEGSGPNYLVSKFLTVGDRNRAALSNIYRLRRQYLATRPGKSGDQRAMFESDPDFQNMKRAAESEDQKAFNKAKVKYVKKGKRYKNFAASCKSIDPIRNSLNAADERRFREVFLSAEQQQDLVVAQEYARTLSSKMRAMWNQAQ